MQRKVRPDTQAQEPISPSTTTHVAPPAGDASLSPRSRRGNDGTGMVPASSTAVAARRADGQTAGDIFKAKLATAVGCKTSEVASALLDQIVKLEHPTATTPPERIQAVRMNAIALLGELQPTSTTESMLAVQMIGAHRAAMRSLADATHANQTADGADRSVLRAVRLMRLFTEQVETMARLKGQGTQQRVVVEHVTVAAGGQAIVGAIMPGGRGSGGDDTR